ncbi:hypothetical protein [Stenotrophomonas nematodicola]|uniref:Uncharacterized protein n=1 Tax=Stenotrophomonas nematodicola TaxID=2656746 RepID=A0ABW7CZ72_9GAMM
MESDLSARVSDHLLKASGEVSAASSRHELKQSLVGLIQHLQDVVSRIENDHPAEGPWSEDHFLHERALEDYDRIQKHLSAVATTLADQERFVWMLRNKGNDIDAYRTQASTVASLDRAIEGVVHLMQFDTPKRMEVDIRKGFMFTSGSVNYGRTYF